MAQNFNFAKFSDAPGNKPEEPPGPANAPAPSLIDSYSSFFEVDTPTVLLRLKKTLWPFDRSKFFENKADLYGAIWVPTTLIFLLSAMGSVPALFSSNEGYTFNPSVLVMISALIYFFIFAVPAVLSMLLMPIDEVSFTELLSLYGYSFFTFCISAVLSVPKFTYLRWGSFGLASIWGGVLLTKNYYSQINSSQGWKKYLTILISLSGYAALTATTNLYLFN